MQCSASPWTGASHPHDRCPRPVEGRDAAASGATSASSPCPSAYPSTTPITARRRRRARHRPDFQPCRSLDTRGTLLWFIWLRGMDLNHRPSGYEPDELPTALPRHMRTLPRDSIQTPMRELTHKRKAPRAGLPSGREWGAGSLSRPSRIIRQFFFAKAASQACPRIPPSG